jgi:hypothetical protein
MRVRTAIVLVALIPSLLVASANEKIPVDSEDFSAEAHISARADTITPSMKPSTACWLYRWRGMTWDDVKEQSVNWEKSLEASWGSTLFSVVLLGCSIFLMLGGWWLGPKLMFFVGLACGTASTYFLIDHIFNAAGWSNCWVMGIGSLLGGILAGFALLRMFDLGLFCLGAALGGILGYWFYGVVLAQHVHTKVILGYDALFWVCVLVAALVVGIIALKMERNLIIATTAVGGAFLFTLSIDQLCLGGGHFNLSQLGQNHSKGTTEDKYFYGLAAASVVLSILSIFIQSRLAFHHRSHSDGEVDIVYVEQRAPQRRRTAYFAV